MGITSVAALHRVAAKRRIALILAGLLLVGGLRVAHSQLLPTPVDVLDEFALHVFEAGMDDFAPSIATDEGNTWLAVWSSENYYNCGTLGQDTDILWARSTNRGATWHMLGRLNSNACSDTGDDYWPQIQTDGRGTWLAVWQSNEDLGGTADYDEDIFFARSTDNGLSWTDPALLNSGGTSDSRRDYSPRMATNGAGKWVVVWWARVGGDADVLVSRSSDNGMTWTPEVQLNSIDLREDSNPEVATDQLGNWVVTWDSNGDLGGLMENDFNILVSRSMDDGVTWTPPTVLNTDASSVAEADGISSLATDRRGNWVAVWTRWHGTFGSLSTDIMVARSADDGTTWNSPLNISAQSGAPPLNLTGSYTPKIATDRDGNWVTVWYSIEPEGGVSGSDSDIFASYSTDNGATWTPPAILNTNAMTDVGDDRSPQIAVDRRGNWTVVWDSDEDLFWDPQDWDYTSHAWDDYDIFYARFAHPRVVVTIPNGGETVVQGARQKIKWHSIGDAGEFVKIDLMHKGQFQRHVKKSTANDGKATWQVDPSVDMVGNGYKIRVTPRSAPAGSDISDNAFSIVP